MNISIVSEEPRCFVCDSTINLHKHHIYAGRNRKLSDADGCWCWLCAKHHNMSDEGVHFNYPFDVVLKKYCQSKWMEVNGDKDDFIKRYGRSYL